LHILINCVFLRLTLTLRCFLAFPKNHRFHYKIYFAEFLQISSPIRLSIFNPWTCVGLRYSLFSMVFLGYRNSVCIDESPSNTAFAFFLGTVLNLRCPPERRNPSTFGDLDSYKVFRYSSHHSHFSYLQYILQYTFLGLENGLLPYPVVFKRVYIASVVLLVPYIFGLFKQNSSGGLLRLPFKMAASKPTIRFVII